MARSELALAAVLLAASNLTPAMAGTLRSEVAFNTGIGQPTADQPPEGVRVAYRVAPTGDLQDCTVDIVESLYPRDDGAWGFFDVSGEVKCAAGGFAYHVSGAFDANGFHGAGSVDDGSGSGAFEGLTGRLAVGGGLKPAADGTFDVAHWLMFDTPDD